MLQKTNTPTAEIFTARFRQLRHEHDMTQEELAEALQVSRTSVANWESGRRVPDISTVILIAKIFRVPVDYLCGTSDKRYNVNIPDNVNLDLTKLNGQGISMLLSYYEFLASNADYKEI